MATVEELRGKVFKIVNYSWQHTGLEETLDSLITAAKKEERERIMRLSDICKEGDRLDSGTGSYFLANTMVATANVFIIPDFLLSPAPKENP